MNQVAVRAGAARGAEAERSAWPPAGRMGDGRQRMDEVPCFPVVCLMPPTELTLPLVGDDAGGNRSLAQRVFSPPEKAASFYLATSRSRAGRSSTHHLP